MSHLDEGTLHALLDGELETHEVAEIQAHLGSCSSCGLRLREVKEFYTEADRLIASVDVEATAPMSAARLAPVPPGPQPEPAPRREATPRPQPAVAPSKWEPWNEPPPMLLLPDNESAAERRMRRMRRLGWAAILLVVVGAGAVEARKFMPMAVNEVQPASNTKTVVSQEEAPARDAGTVAAAPLAKADTSVAAPTRTLATSRAEPRQAKSATPAPAKALASNTDRLGPSGDRKDSAVSDEVTEQSGEPVPDQAAGTQVDSGTDQAEADTAGVTDLAAVRERAAEALADLDRERRVKQAAAATAALDANKRKTVARSAGAARGAAPAAVQPAAAPAPAPAPPTLEQRARVYLRIGLDEASRQLGGPAHVIEGLSPLFMGLAQGTSVAGADATRPVVRVVYQDSQGRLILLDQQRVRAGQALPPPGPLSWTIGGTVMWLNGEAGADILRTYRPRVR
jgi:hypothetical protein